MKEIEKKVEELRKNSKEFNSIFKETTLKIEELIRKRNSARSVRPKNSSDMKMRVKVTAIPLTKEEMVTLERYLEEKYIDELDEVDGDYFSIRKCIFSNKYIIESYDYTSDFDW